MMKMVFTFDKEAVAQNNFSLEKIYDHMKQKFAERNLVCISDGGDALTFTGTGSEHDLSRMLIMMGKLREQEWFMNTAKSWLFTTDERRGWEDVLASIRRRHDRQKLEAMR